MSSSLPPDEPDNIPENPQALVGFMSNEEWDALLAYVDSMITEMEELPLPEVKDKVFELLAGIDSIHREGLWRLVRLFKEGVLEQVITDPAIHTLMELYDLLPPDSDNNPEAITETAKVNFPNIPIKVIPLEKEEKSKSSLYPHWVPVLDNKEELESGAIRVMNVDDQSVILCRVEDEFFALVNACAQDGKSLEHAKLNSYTLSCPNHPGCHYDIRLGSRIAGDGEIECYPIQINDNGSILIGIGMAYTPKVPTF